MTTQSAVLDFLQQRTSSPRLSDPAPSDEELAQMLRCAVRSPDHAWLRPWRFVSIRGERRNAFGELLLHSLLRRNPDADEAARQKALNAPLRAPLIIAVMASVTEHPKVPAWEQRLSAGCAAFSLTLAAEALGYAAVWRTGSFAEDQTLVRDLGGAENEQFVAFVYVGRRDCPAKAIPDLALGDFHRVW
jgi:nitroreductase